MADRLYMSLIKFAKDLYKQTCDCINQWPTTQDARGYTHDCACIDEYADVQKKSSQTCRLRTRFLPLERWPQLLDCWPILEENVLLCHSRNMMQVIAIGRWSLSRMVISEAESPKS